MVDDERKPRFHFHLFRLIIIIAIIFVLLKVDIKSIVKSPQLQENISYVKNQAVSLWERYLAEPVNNAWDSLFKGLINKGIDTIQNSVDNKLEDLKQ